MNLGKALIGSALVYTLTNALSAGVPFLMIPVLTRVLTPAEYGQVAMFSVVTTVLGGMTGLSVHGAVGIRYFDKEQIDFPRYVASCLVILFASTVAVMMGVVLLLPWLQELTKLPAAWLLVAVVVSCAQFIIQIQLTIWQSAKQPWRYGALKITQSVIDASLSLALIVWSAAIWQSRTSGMAVATLLIALVVLRLLFQQRLIKFPPSKDYVANAIRFGVPLIPHVMGGMLIALIDRVMISNVLDVASTGVYMVALQIGMVLGLAVDSFNRAYAPWLIESLRHVQPDRDIGIVRFTYAYFLIITIVALSVGRCAPQILGALVGEKFRVAAPIVVYITMGFAFSGMYSMVTNYIFFAGRTLGLAIITLLSGLINVLVCYFLLQRNGVVGAAQAFMIAQLLLFLGAWWLANQSRAMPWIRALQRHRAS